MKISFCMPVHNKEPYLASAIESVLGQSHKDWELIIVDDNSSDGSRFICEHFLNKSSKIKLMYLKKNVGVASARNIAWGEATGDIICPQDADDLSATHRARITSKFFKENPKIGLMYGSCGAIDQDNKLIERRDARWLNIYEMKQQNYIQHITVGFRRNLEVKYRDGVRYIDDWYFYLDCIRAGIRFGYVKDLLGLFRVVPDGLSFGGGGFDIKPKTKKKNALRKEFVNLEADLADRMENPLQKHRMTLIKNLVPKDIRVLDVGCNSGYFMDMVQKKSKIVDGVEYADNLADICRKKGHKVYSQGDAIHGKYDCIVMGDILEHYDIETASKMVDRYYRLLDSGGKLIITAPHKLGPYREEHLTEHVRDVSLEDFKKYKNIKGEAVFYGDYAIPVWNLVVITK